ncbi:hypothetical protein IAT38_007328 [Cryptococcus sp. DSM 104549]
MLARVSQIIPAALVAATVASAAALEPTLTKRAVASPGVLGFLEPPARGWDYSSATQSPCGGISGVNRSAYGLSTGLEFQVENDVSNVVISYASSSDLSGSVVLATVDSVTAGIMCLEGENVFEGEGFGFGDNITLQISFHDDVTETDQYQCADLQFTSDHVMSVTCSNTSTIITASGSSTTTGTSSTVTVTASSSSGLTALQAGWLGACVTFAVLGLALIASWYFGLVFFSRRSHKLNQLHVGSQRMADRSADDISLQRRTTVDHKMAL